jgi:hypothetical protein
MKLKELQEGQSIDDLVFISLLDIKSPNHDKDRARSYGLENWAELSEESRRSWDWVFDKETRVKRVKVTPYSIRRKLAIAEDLHCGFDDETTGTL